MRKLILLAIILLPILSSAQKLGVEVGYVYNKSSLNGVSVDMNFFGVSTTFAGSSNVNYGWSTVGLGYNIKVKSIFITPSIYLYQEFKSNERCTYDRTNRFDFGIKIKYPIEINDSYRVVIGIGRTIHTNVSASIGFLIM